MEDLFKRLRQAFSKGNILTKLIFINAGVFVIVRLLDVCFTLFNYHGFSLLSWLQLPSSPSLFAVRFWTILTYMFTHYDVLHIIFNMLVLYCFGRIFLQFFNLRQLGSVYILGGIAGGLLFMLAYNLIPYFYNKPSYGLLMGASASVMAIMFAVSFYRKDYEISFLFIGRIKLIYVAVIVFLMDILSITSDNSGGHIAHLGGAFMGIYFASRLNAGKDPTALLSRLIDRIINLKKPKTKMNVTHRRTETNYEHNARRNRENAEIDAILDKLKQSGYESLSSDEKKKLFDVSRK